MSIVKNKTTEENREFWSHVESVAEGVKSWLGLTDNTFRNDRNERPGIDCQEGDVPEHRLKETA
jgi:hypothetical protein